MAIDRRKGKRTAQREGRFPRRKGRPQRPIKAKSPVRRDRPPHRERPPRELKEPPNPALLYTVGMGRRPLQHLMQLLVDKGIELVADVRAHAAEAGTGFTRERDLAFLLKEVAGIEYRREELLVPTREMREQYRRDKNWPRFEEAYLAELSEAKVEETLDRERYAAVKACLLGDHESPDFDHRRLAAEYLKQAWNIETIRHL